MDRIFSTTRPASENAFEDIGLAGEPNILIHDGFRLPPTPVETQKTISATAAIEREVSPQGRFSSDTGSDRRRVVPPALRRPASSPPEKFIPLESWEGVVETIGNNSFTARVVSQRLFADEESAELPLAEVSDEDVTLLEPGAVFYWAIGYAVSKGGQRRRESLLRFRRTPPVGPREDARRVDWVTKMASWWLK